jgi:hypothetical protein
MIETIYENLIVIFCMFCCIVSPLVSVTSSSCLSLMKISLSLFSFFSFYFVLFVAYESCFSLFSNSCLFVVYLPPSRQTRGDQDRRHSRRVRPVHSEIHATARAQNAGMFSILF